MPILINDNTARVQYTATAGQTVFIVPYEFFEVGDLKVYNGDTLLAYNVSPSSASQYSVTGAGVTGGGSITLGAPGAAISSVITIVRDILIKRLTDFPNAGPFNIQALNAELDKLTAVQQNLETDLDNRVLRLGDSDTPNTLSALPNKAARQNKLLGFDIQGQPTAYNAASLATLVAYATAYADTFTGDGIDTTFTLSGNPAVIANLDVSINGVTQVPFTDYTLSGTTLTTTTAVPNGAVMLVKFKEGLPNYSGDAQDIRYTASFSGAVQQNVKTKLEQSVSVKDFGAVGNGVTDDTAAIQAALNSGAASVGLTGKVYAVAGTLTIPAGVTLIGQTVASEYFPGGLGSTMVGSCLHKLSTGTNGPLVILQSSSGISNIYLKHSKVGGATTGIVQVGVAGATDVYNSSITNVTIYGVPTTDLTGTTTCYGIFYPNGSVSATDQRYFNRASNFYITNTDVGIRLGENCNGNTFSSFVIRQVYQHILLDGIVGGCVENVFSGFVCANIGVLPTSPTTVFTLKNYSLFNTFTGYTTECNGSAFSIDATCSNNSFFGNENETALSVVPPNNVHSLWTQPANRSQQSQMLIPTVAAPQNYTGGAGNLVRFTRAISGTLPTLNSSTFTAADPSSKVIARFNPTVYSKSVKPGFRARLTLALNAPGGSVGESIVEVEFFYRVTDNSTQAAQLSVISVVRKPATNYITGLKFLTGVASGLGFGIAVVGGNVGPVAATHIIADLEILAFTFSVNSVAMADYADVTWASIPATANDVTDAIDLLTVADTAI